jgi:acyl-[acyl-carrier-protein]-phospholipid O-acyltransferase/long-chain-fatty-acid--[acyl-carrier-protein] ligase
MPTVLWPNAAHAAVAVPDSKKGEQIVLLTTHSASDRDALREAFQHGGMSALAVPRRVVSVTSIPLLGTGKIDYQSARRMARDEADGAVSTDYSVEAVGT